MRPILKGDGAKKNDCEAAKRLLEDVRREHPRLKLVVLEDGGPHVNLLKELDMRFILGAKPGDHKFLFEWVNNAPSVERREFTDEDNIRHEFRYGVPLNDTHFDLKVNFHWEKLPNGKKQRFSWVTDLPIDEGSGVDAHRSSALEGTKLSTP